MAFLFLTLWAALDVTAYNLEEEYFLLFQTSGIISFSSFRLTEPERIVVEITGVGAPAQFPPPGATVTKIERSGAGDRCRLIFHITSGSAYTILQRKNMLLLGFRQELFVEDDTIETMLAKIERRIKEKEEQRVLAKAQEGTVAPVAPTEKPVVPEKRPVAKTFEKTTGGEESLVASLAAEREEEKRRREEEERRLAELKRAEEEKRRREEEERRLAELKRAEEEKRRREEEERRLAELKRAEEEKRRREEEERRLAELKRAEEEKRRREEEERRLAELKRAEEEKRRREEEERRLAELKRAEEEKRRREEEERRLALQPPTEEEKIRSLKVVKAEPTRQITEEAPLLKVVALAAKGKLKNLYFRKFPEFSRVTMEVTGELDYVFREIKGGYVIDIHNFEKIPRHLVHIIDARAFNAEVKYIYPKKVDNIFKIYIKADQKIAVRKSEEEGGTLIHFDFYVPTLE